MPWALDPKAEQDIVVVRGRHEGPLEQCPDRPAGTSPTTRARATSAMMLVFGASLLVGGLGTLGKSLAAGDDPQE